MKSGPQMLACWRWLRGHEAAHPAGPGLHSGRGHVRLPMEGPAPWWHAAAAEMLFGSAPFEVHPHHMRTMQEGILTVFASMLVRKMMAAWMQEVRNIRDLLQQLKQQIKLRTIESWKGAAAKCRRLREQELHVSNQRNHQMMTRSIRHWEQRWSKLVQHRSSLQEFDVACWHRSCRRAMDAWLMVVHWEAIANKLLSRRGFRMQMAAFQAWMAQWHHDRKESVLSRLSALFLRKQGLMGGVRALRWNALAEVRKRALAKAKRKFHSDSLWRRRITKSCWDAMSQYSEQRRLLKLYQSWADVHLLRTRLAVTWRTWRAWLRKRLGSAAVFFVFFCFFVVTSGVTSAFEGQTWLWLTVFYFKRLVGFH